MHRVLQIVATALIIAGLVVLADVGLTLLWKEPMSTVYGAIKQGQAESSLTDLERSFIEREDVEQTKRRVTHPKRQARRLARLFASEAKTGRGIGRLKIPSIDLDVVVVQGTDTASLQKGPGHYPETAFPGQGRTVAIAGHRTTYLAPFRHINEIADGDEIVLEMPYGKFTYEVQKHRIVDPYQVGIVRNVGYERLVLTACHPLYSAAERWAVFARLTGIDPEGARAARRLPARLNRLG